METTAGAAAATSPNRVDRARVIDYYAHCWNDYRILWRTDETGSVHFGFFDEAPGRVRDHLHSAVEGIAGVIAALAAGIAGARGRSDAALRWLRVAARGRAARHDAAQHRMTAECANAVGLSSGDLLLDAGCGVGGTDLWLAAARGVRVHGVNIQPAHLREARRRAATHPAGSRVGFSMQDFTELAIATASVDVVWALESLCHSADKEGFVREAFRVLRPGGRLMVADFFLVRDEVPPDRERAMSTWNSGWALPPLANIEWFRRLLTAQGFCVLSCRDIGPHVLPSSRRLFKASLVAWPIHLLLQAAGTRSALAGANVRAAFHQYTTLRDGIWTYCILAARK
jgi:SAM-dependent methyltransferase